MAKATRTKKPKKSKGLKVKTFQGLNQKRMKKGTGGSGKRLIMKDGDTIPVQFLTNPDDFQEFEIHNFQEDGRWEFVPCTGDDCPLCDDESDKKSGTRYRFCAVVYNLKEKRVQILEGPKDLAGRIYYRYERNPSKFRRRAFDITKFPTQPVTYGVDIAEDAEARNPKGLEMLDLDDYLEDQLKRYYGDDLTNVSANSLDDDDDYDEDIDDEEEEWDDDELDALDDFDDEDDEDDDDDEEEDDWDDEDEDDEEEEERPRRKKPAQKKRPAAKKSSGSSGKKKSSSSAKRRRR